MCLVWDLASRTLVGRLDPLSSNLFDITHKVTRLTVHGRSRHLITWTNHPRFWGVLPLDLRDSAERVVSHEARVVAAVHNCTFDRLLTVDTSGALALPPPACPGLPPGPCGESATRSRCVCVCVCVDTRGRSGPGVRGGAH